LPAWNSLSDWVVSVSVCAARPRRPKNKFLYYDMSRKNS